MSINNLYAAAGLTLGAVLGFITRDDYINSSSKKIMALRQEYELNLTALDGKVK